MPAGRKGKKPSLPEEQAEVEEKELSCEEEEEEGDSPEGKTKEQPPRARS